LFSDGLISSLFGLHMSERFGRAEVAEDPATGERERISAPARRRRLVQNVADAALEGREDATFLQQEIDRRSWDQLGYLRARSLANPTWKRDIPWLLRVLVLERGSAPEWEAAPYELAIAAVRRYPQNATGATDKDAAWDQVLTAIDAILIVRQQRHTERVIAAGSSGTSTPQDPTASALLSRLQAELDIRLAADAQLRANVRPTVRWQWRPSDLHGRVCEARVSAAAGATATEIWADDDMTDEEVVAEYGWQLADLAAEVTADLR
jgi:hypothetical protein